MRRKQKIYRALTLLWHTADGRYVAPGEAVSLEHLNDEEIAILIAMNAIEEVKNGTDHRSDQPEELQD